MATTIANSNAATQAEIRDLSPINASFVVQIEGANAVAYRMSDGTILSSGATHATVINQALAAVSGTSLETVSLKGSFVITTPLLVESFTVLDINGALTGTSATNGVIENANATDTDITIRGGVIDVDNTSTPWNKLGLNFSGVTRLNIEKVRVLDSGTHCISVSSCENVSIEGCQLENAGDDCISVLQSTDVLIIDNFLEGGANNGNGGGSSGIEIEDGSYHVSVTGNAISGIQQAGAGSIQIALDSGGTAGCHDITLMGNVIKNASGSGINISNNKVDDTISALSATGDGTVEITSAGHLMTADQTWDITIDGVTDSGLSAINGQHTATYIDANTVSIPVTATGTYTSGGSIQYDHYNITVVGNVMDNIAQSGLNGSSMYGLSVIANSLNNTNTSNASAGAINFGTIQYSQISSNAINITSHTGISLLTSDNVVIIGNTVKDGAALTNNTYGLLANACTNCRVMGNTLVDTRGTVVMYGIRSLNGGPNYVVHNDASSCKLSDSSHILTTGTGDIVYNNIGTVGSNYTTVENSGTGSITSGGTTDVITHGLNITPSASDINITLTEDPTNTPGAIWISAIGATTFTVNCENDPGASNLDFSWSVSRIG